MPKSYEDISARLKALYEKTQEAELLDPYFDQDDGSYEATSRTRTLLGLPDTIDEDTHAVSLRVVSPDKFEEELKLCNVDELEDFSLSEIYKYAGEAYAEVYYRFAPFSCANLLQQIYLEEQQSERFIQNVSHCLAWHTEYTQWRDQPNRRGYRKSQYDTLINEAIEWEMPFERLEVLLNGLPKITGTPYDVFPLYHSALIKGKITVADRLLERLPPHEISSHVYDSILVADEWAARAGHLKYFELRYPRPESGSDTPETKYHLRKAINSAAVSDNLELMQALWDRTSYDDEPQRINLWNEATFALTTKPGRAITWLIQEKGFKMPSRQLNQALSVALNYGRTDVARLVYRPDAMVDLSKDIWNTSVENLLIAQRLTDLSSTISFDPRLKEDIGQEKADLIRGLVDKESITKIYTPVEMAALLNAACRNKTHNLARLYSDLGAQPSALSISAAVLDDDTSILKMLLEQKPDLDKLFPDVRGIYCSIIRGSSYELITQNIPSLRLLRDAGVKLRRSDVVEIAQNGFIPQLLPIFKELTQFKDGQILIDHAIGKEYLEAEANSMRWQQRVHMDPPKGLETRSPYGFKPGTFAQVKPWINKEMYGSDKMADDFAGANQYAYNLAVIFGTSDRVLQYLDKFGDASVTPLHDLAQFKLPSAPGWSIPAWGDACLKYGPSMAKYVKFAGQIGNPQSTLNETRQAASKFVFARAGESPSLAAICYELEVDETDFVTALDAHKRINPSKASAATPDIIVEGDLFGLPGYVWKRAPVGDSRILIAGTLVNCCQHVGGVGEECAIHSATDETGCCYFLSKPDKSGERIVAVSWGWTGKDGTFCLDSYEPIHPEFSKAFPKIVDAMSIKLQAEHPEVTAFTIGTGGRTPELKFPVSKGSAPKGYLEYRDSDEQYVVFGDPQDQEVAERAAMRLQRAAENDRLDPGVPF